MYEVPKVSIVIPVYNTEKFLEECLDSVLNQTIEEIEIVCVDDGSTDGSGRILDTYALQDSRLTVIHKTNAGYGHAVNRGIEASTGEYIGIVEPDDYIKPAMYDELYQIAKKNDLDLISSDYEKFTGEGKKIFKYASITKEANMYCQVIEPKRNKEIFKGDFLNQAGLFKRELIEQNEIRHNETPGAAFQDRGFCFLTLVYAKRVLLLNKAFYCYRQDNIQSSIANKRNVECVLGEYGYLYELIKKMGKSLMDFSKEFCYKAYASYRYTFIRCADDLKVFFLYKVKQELEKWIENEMFCVEDFPEQWRQEMQVIMESPEEFYKQYNYLSEEIHELIKMYDDIVIYGAGVVGKRIYDEMYDEDKKKVFGFAVTNKYENQESYKGIQIREIEAYEKYKNKMAFVVGVTEKYRNEIVNNLKEKGFEYILILDTLGTNI